MSGTIGLFEHIITSTVSTSAIFWKETVNELSGNLGKENVYKRRENFEMF